MDNKGKIRRLQRADYLKQYRIDHAAEINEKRKERIQCECGLIVCKRHVGQHLRNSLHKKELQKRNEILEEKRALT